MKMIRICRNVTATILSLSFVSCASGRNPQASVQDRNTTASSSGRDPAPPAVLLDTTYPATAGRTIPVGGGEANRAARAFQGALDSARPGDVIALEAGGRFEGNFKLPKKEGAGWVVIRSSASDDKLPPAGTRIGPSYAPLLPKLVSPNADAVVSTAPGAHHYRFVGVEFTTKSGWAQNHGLILLGDGGASQDSPEDVPHNLIIDRCYIHGDANINLRRAVALNSGTAAIIDSFIADVHEAGADSQAICGWNGPGPFKIVNNYLEAAGENVMFGGADPKIRNLVPSDIEFRLNHCSKPLNWMHRDPSFAGKRWSVKNLFELKNARRVMIDGNLFEHNWVEAQSGFGILFTVRNQEGTAPWSVVEDISFTNNIVRRSAAGVNLLGRDDNNQSEQVKRVLIRNNLFDDVGGTRWGKNGRFLQITETVDVTVDHNTILHSGNIITAYGTANAGFVFTNNIAAHNEYGVIGDGASVGNASLDRYFPARVFRKNVIAGGKNSIYPSENFFPPALDAVFADRAAGNFSLKPSSPYKNAATDGKNIGCDITELNAAMSSAQQ
jgi:hypothetical protein